MSDHYSDPDCPKCGGRGFIYAKSLLTLPGEKGGHYCECTIDALKLENMERVWKSLSEARILPGMREKAVLRPLAKRNAWITAPDALFKAHLKALAFNMSTMWDCRVYSDKDLLSAWLKTARAQGHKIYDTEIDEDVGFSAMDIDELVEPPGLVILKLGVKHAPNKEGPNCLLEALTSRKHIGRPTWIIDQPDYAVDQMHHRFYSETLESWLAHWPHVRLGKDSMTVMRGVPLRVVSEQVEQLDDVVEKAESAEVDEMLADLGEQDELEEADEEIEEEEDTEEEEEEGDPAWMATVNTQESRKKKKAKKKPWKRKGS